jgi:transposase
MLKNMARSAIKYLKKRGNSNAEIARVTKHHPRTIAKVLEEPTDKTQERKKRESIAAIYRPQIEQWLRQKISVKRMLEMVAELAENPYKGKPTAFYSFVREVKSETELKEREMAIRFEGLPAEFLQIDWGEVRDFPFLKPALVGETRYFFAARLKYSRFMFVCFTTDMTEETLIRCVVECLRQIGGVPWVVTTDNMKTAVIRHVGKEIEFNQTWQKLAFEYEFHPEACTPARGNQKGAVENLVKFVKTNFLAGRSFFDEADLAAQLTEWLRVVNYERKCAATGEIPAELLPLEQAKMGKLPDSCADYGLFESLVVSREGVVHYQTNRYSVPSRYIGQTLTARIHKEHLRLYDGEKLVAEHSRSFGRNLRIVIPEHYETTFNSKPRGRMLVYRDFLMQLSENVAEYLSYLSRRQRASLEEQVLTLYRLAQKLGKLEFCAALDLAMEQGLYGAEYVVAIAEKPYRKVKITPLNLPVAPQLERHPAEYELVIANRAELAAIEQGGQR